MTQKIAENKKYNAIAFRCWIEEKGYKKSTTGWFETIYADAPGPYTSRKISHVAKTDSELYDLFATSSQDPDGSAAYEKWLEESPSPSPGLRWTSIKDGLPVVGRQIMLFAEYLHRGKPSSEMFIGWLGENGECYKGYDDEEDYGWTFEECITYWAPMPLGPQESPSLPGEQDQKAMSAKEIKDANDHENWHPQNYSGRFSPEKGEQVDVTLMTKAIRMRDAYNVYIHTLAGELFVFRGGKDRGIDHFKEQQDARNDLSDALKPFIGTDLQPTAPSAEKGEQVEGKSETPSYTDDIIFPFSGYALREGYFGGKYHGYPECCILWYLGETEIHKKSKEDLQGIDVLKNGFLPCPQHQDMIRGGEIRIEDLIQNRICPEPFSELPELNAGQSPLIESNQTDIKRIGLKAFDDSMKNTLGELIEAEESPFAESEADQQVPEGSSLINLSEIPMTDKVDFVDGLVNICCHNLMKAYLMLGLKWGVQTKVINEATSEHFVFQFLKVDPASQTPLLSDMLEAEKAANATLKESFKSSIYQHDQNMEIVKGERDELRDLLNILYEGYSDQSTNFLNDRISEALNRFTNNKDK